MLPALVVHAQPTPTGTQVSAGVLFALLAAAQAVALLWLRRAPRTAQGVLLGLAPLWPVATAAGDYTGPVVLPPVLSILATCAAIAADASRTAARVPVPAVDASGAAAVPPGAARSGPGGFAAAGGFCTAGRWRRAGRAWLLPASAVVVHAAAAVVAVVDRGTTVPLWAVVGWALSGASLAVGAARRGGTLRARRDLAARGTRDERLAAWTEEAVRDAWAERRRIAAGLETTVLARTADMVTEAEAGLADVSAERAREALAAMRALLDTVRQGRTEPELRPQPTLQALDLLARQCRATGRDVEIRLTDRVPERLPTAVDLAAYHAAETVLAAAWRRARGARTRRGRRYVDSHCHRGAARRPHRRTGAAGGTGRGARRHPHHRPAGHGRSPAATRAGSTAGRRGEGAMSLRVLVVDDQGIVRAGFAAVIDAEEDLTVVGEAADGVAAVRLAEELAPDVVVMDVRMPELDGIAATRIITGREDAPRVLVLTTFDLDAYVFDALRGRRVRFPAQGRAPRRTAARHPGGGGR